MAFSLPHDFLLLEDVLKARVTTIGSEEHIIVAESGSDSSKRWTIYDIGGSRSQRGKVPKTCILLKITPPYPVLAAWAQFFDDGAYANFFTT